jgi:diacylglycerol kinase
MFGSFKYATDGVEEAFKSEPNFRIHIAVGIIAMIMAYVLKFTPIEWAILFLTETFVISMELINTVLEAIVDIVSPEKRQKARIAKDVSAAFVLLSAIAAAAVGIVLFLPKILPLLSV